jgi:hypothetical protein
MLKVMTAELPPGAGLVTTIWAAAAVAMSEDGMSATSCVALT